MADYLVTKVTDIGGNPRFETIYTADAELIFKRIGIGITTSDKPLHVAGVGISPMVSERTSSTPDSVLRVLELYRRTSGTAAPGIGASIAFRVEDDAGNLETAAVIAGLLTDTSSNSEEGAVTFEVVSDSSLITALRIQGLSGGLARIEITGQVEITGGGPDTGKVLTSDQDGLATWEFPYNDQVSSGYFDIGTMRIQWGSEAIAIDSAYTVTLPASFANASYVISFSWDNSWTSSGAVQGPMRVGAGSKTITQFQLDRDDDVTGTINTDWIAIGLKP